MEISRPKRVTLHDVARLANTSYATVSRVINNNPEVSEQTRQRVLQAIEKLHFVPNRAARSLIKGRTYFLQVLITNYSYLDLFTFCSLVKESGYGLGMTVVSSPTAKGLFRQTIREVVADMVDGFFIVGPEFDFDYDEMDAMCMGKPFVQVGGKPNPNIPLVAFDQAYGISQGVQHLYKLGHRQIAEISGTLSLHDGYSRHQAFRDAMLSLQLSPELSLSTEYFSIDNGYQCCKQLIEKGAKFTALVCGNDSIAMGAMHALWELGLRIPDEISIVGYDDRDISPHLTPPLTTVQQDLRFLYNQAINNLLSRIEEKNTPHFQQIIPPALVIRRSTASPKSKDS